MARQTLRNITQQAQIIEISSKAGDQRAAIASFDSETEEDVLSLGMADILGIQISPIEKERRSAYPTEKVVLGETMLDWSLEKDPRRVYSGTFYVSADQNPNYDVVLGTESAKKLESSARKAQRASIRTWFR